MGRLTLPSLLLASIGVVAGCSSGDSNRADPTVPRVTSPPFLDSVSLDTLVEGSTATLLGTGFSTTPALNTVTIGGLSATVTGATSNRLTVTVPTFDCLPQRDVDVRVSVGGENSGSVGHPLTPVRLVDLAIGSMALIQDAAGFCLQFPPAPAGAGEYLVGIGSAAEKPGNLLSVTLASVVGQPAPVSSGAMAHSRVPIAPVAPTPSASSVYGTTRGGEAEGAAVRGIRMPGRQTAGRWEARLRAEQSARRWEQEALYRFLDGSMRLAPGAGPGGIELAQTDDSGVPATTPAPIPGVGDELDLKVPSLDATEGGWEGVCTPVPVAGRVRVVGNRGIFVTDLENPLTDPLTDADLRALSDALDSFIYDTDTRYFGTPLDLDQNQRIIVLFTIEVNKLSDGDRGATVWGGDFLDPEICPASDMGEIYYSGVPDSENAAGTKARTKDEVLETLPQVLAHELTHLLQISGRLRSGPDARPLSPWEMEGQAMLAWEVVGHQATGMSAGQDYGAAAAFSETAKPWYENPLLSLALYYGYDGGPNHPSGGTGARLPDAPETCTLLFRDGLGPDGCALGSGYGAAWSFFRYLADRYGPAWPGGEAGLMQDWIIGHPTLSGTANVEALLGRSFTEMFAEWAAMHYLDGRVPTVDPGLLMGSWNLEDVMSHFGANAALQPAPRAFSEFSVSASVRGGSTAYSLFTDAAPRPATAIRVRDIEDRILSEDMRPLLWVVRVR